LFVCAAAASYHAVKYFITSLEFTMMLGMSKNNPGSTDRSANNIEAGIGLEEAFLVSDRSLTMGSAIVVEKRHVVMQRLTHAVMSGLSYCLALLLMLAAMTYNTSLFVALVLGYAIGDYLFYTRIASIGLGHATRFKGAAMAGWSAHKHTSECH
jgi:hypothetical protein